MNYHIKINQSQTLTIQIQTVIKASVNMYAGTYVIRGEVCRQSGKKCIHLMVSKGVECWHSAISEVCHTLLTRVGTFVMNEEVRCCSSDACCYSGSQCRSVLVQLWSVNSCGVTGTVSGKLYWHSGDKEVYQYSGNQ